jgi:CARDB
MHQRVLLVALATALASPGWLAAQRPKKPVIPPPESRLAPLPPAPDLVGALVPCPECGTPKLSVVVWNRGPLAATGAVKVELYQQDSLVATKVFSGVAARSQRLLGSFKCQAAPQPGGAPTGSCPSPSECVPNSRVVVDVANAVAESNETNNERAFCWVPFWGFAPAP